MKNINFFPLLTLLTSVLLAFCGNPSDKQSTSLLNESVYRPDSSEVTKNIQSSIDTINWIEVRYVDLGLSVKIPSYWKRRSPQFPIISSYSDTSETFIFKPTYSLKILNQIKSLEQYHEYKIKLHPSYATLVEDNPNPFFWTSNVYTSFIIKPSEETHNLSIASWSFAFKHKNNLVEINLVTDTMRVPDMDLLFKNIINLVDSI